MTERQILDMIEAELRRRRVPIEPRGPLAQALRVAALGIAREAQSERQQAARTASIAGYAITRGRVRP